MRVHTVLLAAALACLQLSAWACEPQDSVSGCRINGSSCSCGYGCKTDYIYINRQTCINALRSKNRIGAINKSLGINSNICMRGPCLRGICIQTTQDPGFTCKCEGTEFYGQRCEKACPTVPMRGLVFPHECVVI